MSKSESKEAIERLREVVKEGDTVFTVLRSVSRSGMMRVIAPIIIRPREDKPGEVETWHIGYNAALALEQPYDRDREGVKVSGCGMDMGFHLVYELSSLLFGWENGGGYKLKHKWL